MKLQKKSGNSNRKRTNFISFCSNLTNEENIIDVTTDSHDFLKEAEDNIDRFNETINDIFTNPRQTEFYTMLSEMTKHRQKYQIQTSYYRNMKKTLNKDIVEPNCSERHDMFISDYDQCLKIPQYHSDQTGETFFSFTNEY